MVAITVHHASDPNTSDSFIDNGGEDKFDPIPTKFWGRKKVSEIAVNELVCGEGSVGVRECYDYYGFWIKTKHECETVCI